MLTKKKFFACLDKAAKECKDLPKWTKEYFDVHFGSVVAKEEGTTQSYIPYDDQFRSYYECKSFKETTTEDRECKTCSSWKECGTFNPYGTCTLYKD